MSDEKPPTADPTVLPFRRPKPRSTHTNAPTFLEALKELVQDIESGKTKVTGGFVGMYHYDEKQDISDFPVMACGLSMLEMQGLLAGITVAVCQGIIEAE